MDQTKTMRTLKDTLEEMYEEACKEARKISRRVMWTTQKAYDLGKMNGIIESVGAIYVKLYGCQALYDMCESVYLKDTKGEREQ